MFAVNCRCFGVENRVYYTGEGGAGFMGLIAAYFGKGYDGREIFDGLKIQQCEQFKMHLNQHNVVYMTFSEIPGECKELPAIYFPD